MRIKCSVKDCNTKSLARGLCNKHYLRWKRHGDPEKSLIREFGTGTIMSNGYKRIGINGKYVLEHVFFAEVALGKPLPPKAVVHHMNEIKDDNYTPFNLVICPDERYHRMLHTRIRDFAEFGECFDPTLSSREMDNKRKALRESRKTILTVDDV